MLAVDEVARADQQIVHRLELVVPQQKVRDHLLLLVQAAQIFALVVPQRLRVSTVRSGHVERRAIRQTELSKTTLSRSCSPSRGPAKSCRAREDRG